MSLIKITDRKREANARNAQRSTGPKTAEGRERSSRNAVTHGCSSVHLHKPMKHENPDHFQRTLAEQIEAWQPVDARERMLVNAIVVSWIRIERSERWESAALDGVMETRRRMVSKALKLETTPELDHDLGCCIAITDRNGSVMWKEIQRHSSKSWRDWHKAVETLRKMQNARKREAERKPISPVESPDMASSCPADPPLSSSAEFAAPAAPVSQSTPSRPARNQSPASEKSADLGSSRACEKQSSLVPGVGAACDIPANMLFDKEEYRPYPAS